MANDLFHMTPFLSPDDANNMRHIAESFGSFGSYADEATSQGLGEELPQRFDVGINYVEAGIDGSGNPDDCFSTEQQHNCWLDGDDDLTLETILANFETELSRRGALSGPRPAATKFALLMVSTFVHYPTPPVMATVA